MVHVKQMRLVTQSVYRYSYDFLVFASVFYNTAPNANRFYAQVAIVFCHVITQIVKSGPALESASPPHSVCAEIFDGGASSRNDKSW